MKYWEPVTEQELDMIHDGACELLEEVGMLFGDPKAVDILVAAGAIRVNEKIVKIPRAMVEQAIKDTPSQYTVYDRKGGSMVIGDDSHHHTNGGTMTYVADYPSYERRPATTDDVRNLITIIDALDAIDVVVPPVEPRDVPHPRIGEIVACAEMLKHTTKYCFGIPIEIESMEIFIEMAKAVTKTDDLSKKPPIGMLATILPGFEIDYKATGAIMIAAREGVPIILMGSAIMGGQSPATKASAVVMIDAEQLGCLCLLQAMRKGSPAMFNWSAVKLDMRTGDFEEGGPEFNLVAATGAMLSRRYGIPSHCSPHTDAKAADLQNGYEMGGTMLGSMLGGINCTVNSGAINKCSAANYESLILHNEMMRNFNLVRKGVTVTKETLCIDVMKEVGIRGFYLDREDTLQWLRESDELLHKEMFDVSAEAGVYEDPVIRANAKWKEILAEHKPDVPAEDKAALDAIVERHTKEILATLEEEATS